MAPGVPFLYVDRTRSSLTEIESFDPDATVRDLAAALNRDRALLEDATCFVDGVVAPSTTRLVDWIVPRGSQVTVARFNDARVDATQAISPVDPCATSDASGPLTSSCVTDSNQGVEVRVVGGLRAGKCEFLGPRGLVVGRSAPHDDTPRLVLNDPTVSERHCTLTVESRAGRDANLVIVEDHHSRNGTWLDQQPVTEATAATRGSTIQVGASVLELGDPRIDDAVVLPPYAPSGSGRRPGDWTASFNRPPVGPEPGGPDPVVTPSPPLEAGPSARLGVIAVVAPVIVGIVMVVALHSLMWGLFAFLGPVMMLGGWWDQRRHGGRIWRGEQRRFEADLATFVIQLHASNGAERGRRRAVTPDLVELAGRALGPSRRLWERRPDHDRWMRLRLGTGDIEWPIPVRDRDSVVEVDRRITACHHAASVLVNCPVAIGLGSGAVVGIVGDQSTRLSVARALVMQACTLHGPADLGVAIVTDTPADWAWARWLSHVADATGRPRIADQSTADDLVDHPTAATDTRESLLVMSDPALLTRRGSTLGRVLGHEDLRMGTIVLVDRSDQLPSRCTTIVELLDTHGSGRLSGRHVNEAVTSLRIDGIDEEQAELMARRQARLEDPEFTSDAARLPTQVRLVDLLELNDGAGEWRTGSTVTAAAIGAQWDSEGIDPAPRAVLGIAGDGPLEIDLAADGPHLIVAGTTGAGKSELLRTLIAGLAATQSPSSMTFMLIDFKGGSAFDRLGDLPHTVGLVTDLSPELAQRTLRCLEAEVKFRERLLRSVAATDIHEYRAHTLRGDGTLAMPRLVVVIDEFATLARDLPDVLDSLVSIAQRGRSLGVHLVLATQRPAGTISDQIRANVALRIVLRLHDAADSIDVIDRPDAARLPRRLPGRALIRFGPDELFTFQVASTHDHQSTSSHEPVTLARTPGGSRIADDSSTAPPTTDLSRLVDVIGEAFGDSPDCPPRTVCPAPLSTQIDLAQVSAMNGGNVLVAVADLPDEQTQQHVGWRSGEGPLVVVGAAGSGTSTTLASLVLTLATRDPEAAHIYVVAGPDRRLDSLQSVTQVGAMVGATESERQQRLIDQLTAVLQHRQTSGMHNGDPDIYLLIDAFSAFAGRWDDPLETVIERLGVLVSQGTRSGIHVALATERLSSIPHAWRSSCIQRWYLRTAEAEEPGVVGGALTDPDRPAGRVFILPEGVTAQVARPNEPLAQAAQRFAIGTSVAPGIEVLPHTVSTRVLEPSVTITNDQVFVPVGLANDTLAPIGWLLSDGDHVVVTGPTRSGRSTALAAIAQVATMGQNPPVVIAVSPRGPRGPTASWRDTLTSSHDAATRCRAALESGRRVFLIVDDADRLPDDGDGLAALFAQHPERLHAFVAIGNEAVRSRFGHFCRTLSVARLALLLRPDIDLDGDLVGIRLPRRSPVDLGPGRGYFVADGTTRIVQVAQPVA